MNHILVLCIIFIQVLANNKFMIFFKFGKKMSSLLLECVLFYKVSVGKAESL